MVKKRKPKSFLNNLYDLNWKQSKGLFPKMKPYGDIDGDGIVNMKDCKPFDPLRHGFFQRAVGVVTGGRYGQSSEEYREERAEKRERKRTQSFPKVVPFSKYRQSIYGKEDPRFRKQLFKERERQLRERAKFEAKVASGEYSSRDLKLREIAEKKAEKRKKEKIIQNSMPSRFIKGIAKERIRQLEVARSIRRSPLSRGGGRTSGRGRGRPKGSYDPRYAEFGGVYGYRKYLRAKLAVEKARAIQESQTSPSEKAFIESLRRKQAQQQLSPERRTIPDTHGKAIPKDIHKEIEDYANVF